MDNPIKMDDLGGPPLFLETPISNSSFKKTSPDNKCSSHIWDNNQVIQAVTSLEVTIPSFERVNWTIPKRSRSQNCQKQDRLGQLSWRIQPMWKISVKLDQFPNF